MGELLSRTCIDIDDNLIKEGLKITRLRTKKELVHYALEELVKVARRKRIMDSKGKLRFDVDVHKMRENRI